MKAASTITFDTSDPAVAEAFANKNTGDKCSISADITIMNKEGNMITAQVDSVAPEDYDAKEEPSDESDTTTADSAGEPIMVALRNASKKSN